MNKHMAEIVIINKYYPNGISKDKIHEYYLKNKNIILKEINGNNIFLLISTDINKFIVRRYINNQKIKINRDNYENIIHPRVISLFIETKESVNNIVIDIDPGNDIFSQKVLDASKDVIDTFFNSSYKDLLDSNYRSIFTGSGVHIIFKLNRTISRSRSLLICREILNVLNNKYIIDKRKYKSDDIVIDLYPQYKGGSHIAPYSVSKYGTICGPIDIFSKYSKSLIKKYLLH